MQIPGDNLAECILHVTILVFLCCYKVRKSQIYNKSKPLPLPPHTYVECLWTWWNSHVQLFSFGNH